MSRFVVRIEMTDRPGALGQVASRIGAVGGDIVAIDIVHHVDGRVVDEFVIDLAGRDLVDLLQDEIHEVDGAAVQSIVGVATDRAEREP
ncbi:MAG: ACT domain-containing protein [Acidimicrobiales bacterium]